MFPNVTGSNTGRRFHREHRFLPIVRRVPTLPFLTKKREDRDRRGKNRDKGRRTIRDADPIHPTFDVPVDTSIIRSLKHRSITAYLRDVLFERAYREKNFRRTSRKHRVSSFYSPFPVNRHRRTTNDGTFVCSSTRFLPTTRTFKKIPISTWQH